MRTFKDDLELLLANGLDDYWMGQEENRDLVNRIRHAARPEGEAREVVIRECWDAINAQIKEGHLPGDGWDESARRNGLIIAANILAGKLGWPIARYAEELPTPQGER